MESVTKFLKDNDSKPEDSFSWEFLKIRAQSEDMREMAEFSCSVGADLSNARKNRYRDILPYDYSRVHLSTRCASDESADYINASFINGANGKVSYIAAQGPLPETVADFWRMIVDYKIQVIVMLCNIVEQGKKKCEQYWPNSFGKQLKISSVAKVSLLGVEKVHKEFVVRNLRVELPVVESSRERAIVRIVRQIQYCGWPDHGVPDDIQPLMDLVEKVREYQPFDKVPILLHCSAGCGRTGTVCGIDYVRSLLKSGSIDENFGLEQIVIEMRRQRPAMVQTLDQYLLLYRIIRRLFLQHLDMLEHHQYENLPLVSEKNIAEISEPVAPPRPKTTLRRILSDRQEPRKSELLQRPVSEISSETENNRDYIWKSESDLENSHKTTTDVSKWVMVGGTSIPNYPYWPLEKPSGPREMPRCFVTKL